MRRAAASAPVPVDAVLHRQTLSLAALQGLQVGQVIEIPRQAVEEIRLAIPQPGGRTALLAQGRLGVYLDNKVIKLTTPPDRRVVTHIERALRPAPDRARAPGPPDAGLLALDAARARASARPLSASMHPIENEQTKLLANALDRASTACLASASSRPSPRDPGRRCSGSRRGSLSRSQGWFAACDRATLSAARRILGGLKP